MMQTLIIVATLILTGVTRGIVIAYAVVTGIVKERMDYLTVKKSTHTSNENYASIIS